MTLSHAELKLRATKSTRSWSSGATVYAELKLRATGTLRYAFVGRDFSPASET
jgi:hypothetical protein